MKQPYLPEAPERSAVDALAGAAVLEFGTNWCGHCQGAQPAIEAAFADYPALPHTKVEDGPGRALGRSYRVKLWPTLVFLRDGVEVARLVRPADAASVRAAIAQIVPAP